MNIAYCLSFPKFAADKVGLFPIAFVTDAKSGLQMPCSSFVAFPAKTKITEEMWGKGREKHIQGNLFKVILAFQSQGILHQLLRKVFSGQF